MDSITVYNLQQQRSQSNKLQSEGGTALTRRQTIPADLLQRAEDITVLTAGHFNAFVVENIEIYLSLRRWEEVGSAGAPIIDYFLLFLSN